MNQEKFDSIHNVVNSSSTQLFNNKKRTSDTKIETDCKNKNAIVSLVADETKKKLSLFKLIMKFTFSNFGLVLVVCIYATVGALVFQLLEQHEELRLCEEGRGKYMKELFDLKDNLFRYVLYNVTSVEMGSSNNRLNFDEEERNLTLKSSFNVNENEKESPEKYIDNMLKNFRTVILDIESKYKYFGKDCVENSKWKFFSSLLFTITAITTIGYGHVTPVTWEGQLVCICYATIGIPIFLLCLTNLSSAFGNMFKFIYMKIDKINPIKKLNLRNQMEKKVKKKSRFAEFEQLLNDSQFSTLTNEQILKELSNLYDPNYDDLDEEDEDDFDEDDEDQDELNKVRIPISIIIFVFFLYFLFGALLFQQTENWKFIQTFYFIYVSLMTIGFGDYVPGQKENDPNSNIKFVAVIFYSLFGIALIGMIISLTQAAARRSFRRLTFKLKRFITNSNKSNAEEVNFIEIDREREKLEILGRIKLLQSYEGVVIRKRNL